MWKGGIPVVLFLSRHKEKFSPSTIIDVPSKTDVVSLLSPRSISTSTTPPHEYVPGGLLGRGSDGGGGGILYFSVFFFGFLVSSCSSKVSISRPLFFHKNIFCVYRNYCFFFPIDTSFLLRLFLINFVYK